MTLLSVAIRPAVNGYIVAATYSGTLPPPFPATSVVEILFTDMNGIGAFLTAQQFTPLPAIAAPVAS